MPLNPRALTLIPIAFLCFESACVTVNVNFPESAVQKATDDYVRDLYRAKEKGRAVPSPAPSAAALEGGWSLIASAEAAEPVFNVRSSKALKIRERLAARLDDVLAQKRAGVLGEDAQGALVVKGADKLKPLLRKKIDRLVDDENADRKELYSEVLTDNQLSKNRLIDIQKSFARSFQAESPAGTWIQDPVTSAWAQK